MHNHSLNTNDKENAHKIAPEFALEINVLFAMHETILNFFASRAASTYKIFLNELNHRYHVSS